MRPEARYIVPTLMFLLFSGVATSQIETSERITLNFDNFTVNFQPGLVFGNLSVKTDRLIINNASFYENTSTHYEIDLEHYNESLTEVMRIDYQNYSSQSKIVWNTSEILSSSEQLFVKDESSEIVYNRSTSHNEEISLEPESSSSTFKFYVSSSEIIAKWNYTSQVDGFKLYRNVTNNPSSNVATGNWTTVVDQPFENYLSNSSGEYSFEAVDLVEENKVYCYRITSYNWAGIESEPKPQAPEAQCVST